MIGTIAEINDDKFFAKIEIEEGVDKTKTLRTYSAAYDWLTEQGATEVIAI